MLEVQKQLIEGTTLEELSHFLGIKACHHPDEPLVILNYTSSSPRDSRIANECRGLILEKDTWRIIGRSFYRFFNLGERLVEDRLFDWSDVTIQTKEDGSLMSLWWYNGQWHVSNKGTFALTKMDHPDANMTWEDCFFWTIDCAAMQRLDKHSTYVFEMCSPYNKIIRQYDKTTLFLLTVIENDSGREWEPRHCDQEAACLGVERPEVIHFRSAGDIHTYLELHSNPTFEGVVVRDRNGRRTKVKSASYVWLHRIRGQDGKGLFNPDFLLPYVLAHNSCGDMLCGDVHELLAYFPELTSRYNEIKTSVDAAKTSMLSLWDSVKHIEEQKAFALAVKHHPLSAVLFMARKLQLDPAIVLADAGFQNTVRKALSL